MIDDLLTWLRAQLDEDELWALAASAPYFGDGPTVAGGVHWTWAVGENWEPVDVDPTASYVGEADNTGDVSLITREVFPLDWDARGLNGRVTTAEEMRIGDGGHIVRWDPARVLAEVAAKRRLIDWIEQTWDRATDCDFHGVDRDAAYRLLALPCADRPGYREEWRP